MAGFDYGEMVQMAVEMIEESGREVTLQRMSGAAANPDKPWEGPGTPTVQAFHTTIGTFVPPTGEGFGIDFIHEDLLKRCEQVVLIAPTQNKDLADYYNVLKDGEVRWGVQWSQALRPGSVPLLYAFGVKR